MSNVDINVDRRTNGRTDGTGRTDGQKIGHLYRTLLQAGAIKTALTVLSSQYLDLPEIFIVFQSIFLHSEYKRKQMLFLNTKEKQCLMGGKQYIL